MSRSKKVIVFGATGVIGTNLIEILTQQQPDWQIVAVSRSGPSGDSRLESLSLPNVSIVKGDVEDLEQVKKLCQDDVHLVYCTVGFAKYETKYWAEHWPVVVDNLLTVSSDEKPLIFCDNLYAYGAGTDLSPATSPTIPPSLSSKPAIRALLREKFQQRIGKSPRSVAVVGGADFFGPHVFTSAVGDIFFGNMIMKQQRPLVIGSGTHLHDLCYAKDFARALYLAGANTDVSCGKFWICPHAVRGKTLRQVAGDVNELLPQDKRVSGGGGGVSAMPGFMVRFLGIFMTLMHEMSEMLPIWTNDYTVDDSDFCAAFGAKATPYEQALRDTIEFYQSQQEQPGEENK